MFIVPKKDRSFRPVINFRKVNEVTEDDRYPLPVLGDLLMSLGQGNTIFSSLDLLSGYWQVPMAAESRKITAFSTPSGHFEWLRIPFCLKMAPITFQRMIGTLFSDLIGKGVYAYLDDLIICSKDGDSHLAKLEAKLTKFEFLKPKKNFLSNTVDRGLCGATVAHSVHNREVPGSIPWRSGNIRAVFSIPSRPCSPSIE